MYEVEGICIQKPGTLAVYYIMYDNARLCYEMQKYTLDNFFMQHDNYGTELKSWTSQSLYPTELTAVHSSKLTATIF